MAPAPERKRRTPMGQRHWRAVLTDDEVDALRDLREADPAVWSYARLAEHFGVSKTCVAKLCRYQFRLPACP